MAARPSAVLTSRPGGCSIARDRHAASQPTPAQDLSLDDRGWDRGRVGQKRRHTSGRRCDPIKSPPLEATWRAQVSPHRRQSARRWSCVVCPSRQARSRVLTPTYPCPRRSHAPRLHPSQRWWINRHSAVPRRTPSRSLQFGDATEVRQPRIADQAQRSSASTRCACAARSMATTPSRATAANTPAPAKTEAQPAPNIQSHGCVPNLARRWNRLRSGGRCGRRAKRPPTLLPTAALARSPQMNIIAYRSGTAHPRRLRTGRTRRQFFAARTEFVQSLRLLGQGARRAARHIASQPGPGGRHAGTRRSGRVCPARFAARGRSRSVHAH